MPPISPRFSTTFTGSAATSPSPETTAPTRELARVLRLPDVILIVVGTVIGSGIFLVPGGVLRDSGGDVGLALLVWIVGGVLSLLGALLLLSAMLLATGSGLASTQVRVLATPLSTELLRGIAVAMVAVLWAYEGWQYVTFSAGEIVEPQRVFVRGIVAGTLAIVAIYLLANLGYLAALGPAEVAQSNRVAADAVSMRFGDTWGRLVTIPILVSIFGAANGI